MRLFIYVDVFKAFVMFDSLNFFPFICFHSSLGVFCERLNFQLSSHLPLLCFYHTSIEAALILIPVNKSLDDLRKFPQTRKSCSRQ